VTVKRRGGRSLLRHWKKGEKSILEEKEGREGGQLWERGNK